MSKQQTDLIINLMAYLDLLTYSIKRNMQKKGQEHKQCLSNPFLQENPFHLQRKFFSSLQTYSKTIKHQQQSFSNHAISIPDLRCQSSYSSWKKTNPFQRKTLLNSSSAIYLKPYPYSAHQNKEIFLPGFLSSLNSQDNCSKDYQDLSHGPSASNCFIKTQNLEPSKQRDHKQNMPELNINIGGFVSPRFGSYKNLCSSNRVNDGLNKIQSLQQVFEQPKIQQKQIKKQTNRSYVNTKRTSSMKQIVDHEPSHKKQVESNKIMQADLSPSEIKVRGSYFYKAKLHNFYTHI